MNAEDNRNARRDKHRGKPKFVTHSKVGGFPKSVWLARKRDKAR